MSTKKAGKTHEPRQPVADAHRRLVALLASISATLACGVPPPAEPGQHGETDGFKRYYIGEQNAYNVPIGECLDDTPLGALGASLDATLAASGWFGVYAPDASELCGTHCSEPADFVENSYTFTNMLDGEDNLWADAATLSVFAGHGGHDLLKFRRPTSTPSGDVCELQLSEQITLGFNSGNRARVALFAASCVGFAADLMEEGGSEDFTQALGLSNSWQYLAFFDSPRIAPPQLAAWYSYVADSHSNLQGWMNVMSRYEGMAINQAIVYTTSNSANVDAAQPYDYIGTRHELASVATKAHLPATAPTPPDRITYTISTDDGDPLNDDPVASDCSDNIVGN